MAMSDPQPDPLDRLAADAQEPHGGRREFQEQLAAIDRRLVAAAERVRSSIVPVTTAFLEADAHEASRWREADVEVDRTCLELEETGYLLLARQAPVAGDLRRIVAVLRCVQDVQRSGDLIRHVAESLTWIHPPSLPEAIREVIRQLGDVADGMFAGAVEAWRTHDGLAAVELERADDQADLLQKVLLSELYSGRQTVEESVSLALIARYYERIADHAVEMARQVAYFLTGDRLPPLRAD